MNRNRVSRGLPSGGQVASIGRGEPQVGLGVDTVAERGSASPTTGGTPQALRTAAASPTASPELLAELVRDDDIAVARAAAENPGAPASAMIVATMHPDSQIRAIAARHQNTSAACLDALSDDPELGVRIGVAENPNTNPATLHRMTQGGDALAVLPLVGRNPSTDQDTLDQLWTENGFTATAVAGNPHTRPETLARIAGSKGGTAGTRAAVAGNVSTPPETVRDLVDAASSEFASSSVEIRRRAAGNTSTPTDLVDRLSCDHFAKVRIEAAGNPNASRRALRAASRDDEALVRAAVALNPSTPRRIRRRLARTDRVVLLRPGTRRALSSESELLADRMAAIRDGFGTHVEVRAPRKKG